MAAALGDYGRWHSILEPKPEDVEEFQNFPGEGIQGKIEVKNIYILVTERLLIELPEQVKSLYILVRINTMIHISNKHEYNIYGITFILKVFGSYIKQPLFLLICNPIYKSIGSFKLTIYHLL